MAHLPSFLSITLKIGTFVLNQHLYLLVQLVFGVGGVVGVTLLEQKCQNSINKLERTSTMVRPGAYIPHLNDARHTCSTEKESHYNSKQKGMRELSRDWAGE